MLSFRKLFSNPFDRNSFPHSICLTAVLHCEMQRKWNTYCCIPLDLSWVLFFLHLIFDGILPMLNPLQRVNEFIYRYYMNDEWSHLNACALYSMTSWISILFLTFPFFHNLFHSILLQPFAFDIEYKTHLIKLMKYNVEFIRSNDSHYPIYANVKRNDVKMNQIYWISN